MAQNYKAVLQNYKASLFKLWSYSQLLVQRTQTRVFKCYSDHY